MWPFTPRNRQETPSDAPATPIEFVPAELADLQAQLSQLTADLAGLRLEWAEVLDKINRWASRQAARERRRVNVELDHLGENGSEIAEDAPGATNGHAPAPGTPEARLAAKQALRSRIRR